MGAGALARSAGRIDYASKAKRGWRGVKMKLAAPGRFSAVRDGIFSALFWAGVPTLFAATYLFAFAADQYVSEAQFVVRGATMPVGGESAGTLGAIIEINTSQDTRIAADYIASGAVLADLEGQVDWKTVYAAPAPDWFAGLSAEATANELHDYWRGVASSEVDVVSGIVTVRLVAFAPDEARELGDRVIQETEAKLNALHRLTLEGASRVAGDRVVVAEERLKNARLELKVFRERYRAIDVTAGARSTFELLSELRRQRIDDRANLAVMRAQGAGNSPVVRGLESRIAAADRQIAALEAQLTGAMDGDQAAATAAIEAYDRLVLRQEMAAQYVARSVAVAARADLKMDQPQVYLDVFVPPAVAEDAAYPRRLRILLVMFAGLLGVWGLTRLVWAGIRSHGV